MESNTRGRLRALRRTVLGAVGAAAAGASVAGAATHSSGDAAGSSGSGDDGEGSALDRMRDRVAAELETRIGYSRSHLDPSSVAPHPRNDRPFDDVVVTKFGKSLEHDVRTGLPTSRAYESLVEACETGEGYDDIVQHSLDVLGDPDGRVGEIDPTEIVEEEGKLGPRPLVQPEVAWSYSAEGRSYADLEIARPPAFDSDQTGAEMVELYWRALARDVPFNEYKIGEHREIAKATTELGRIAGYRGPGSDADPLSDEVTPGNLFRGIAPGAQTGPHVSQLLWKDVPLGTRAEPQRLEVPVAETTPRDYMTDVTDWLKVQNGVAPATDRNLPGNEVSDEPRYIITGRDLAERVHDDPPFRQLQKATQILVFGTQAPLDDALPYTLPPFETQSPLESAFLEAADNPNARRTRSPRNVDAFYQQTTMPFNDFGPLYVEKKVVEASEHGQKAAWHKKWNVHRRLRPEEYGGRVEAARDAELDAAADYPIPDNLMDSEALSEINGKYGSYLLPQAYAEGSPTHPSYPAGHSVAAGAGVTVLKALFDEDYVFKAEEKVFPTADGSELRNAKEVPNTDTLAHDHDVFDELTVGGELNKLATNMALGRNWAGIHYRTDGIEGLRLGEAAAVSFLEDQLTLSPLDGVTLEFRSFDGEPVTVSPTV